MADDDSAAVQDEQDFAIPGQQDDAGALGGAEAPPATPMASTAPPSATAGPPAQAPAAPMTESETWEAHKSDQPSGRAMFLGSLLKTILSGAVAGVGSSGSKFGNAVKAGQQATDPIAQQLKQSTVDKAMSDADQAKIQTSITGMKALQSEYLLKRLPQDDQMKHLQAVSAFKQNLIKEGANVEAEGDDEKASDSQAMHLNGTDPRALNHSGRFYSLPTMDSDGKPKFDTVYVPNKETLQEDYTYTDTNGKEQTIPAGTPMAGAMGKFVENMQKNLQDETKLQHQSLIDPKTPEEVDVKLASLEANKKSNSPFYQQNKDAIDTKIPALQAVQASNKEKADQARQDKKDAAAARASDKVGKLVIAGKPGQQETQVMKPGDVPKDMVAYELKDPQALASTVARFNDVQTKVNELADFVNKGGMDHIQPGLVGDAIAEAGKEIKVGALGAEMPTARINALLDQENYKSMNQASRDFVRNYAFAREAMTQLPAIQTFGKSNRINDTQLKAALQLLPDHKMAGNSAAAKQQMEALQRILDPLRKSIPRGLPGADLTPSFLERNQ